MVDIDIDPFGEHESRPGEKNNPLPPDTPVGGRSTWEPEHEQETSFRGESHRTKLMKDYIKDLYKKLSETLVKPQKHFILIISNLKMRNCTTEAIEALNDQRGAKIGWNDSGYIG